MRTRIRDTFKQLASCAIRKRDVEIVRVALHEGRLYSMSNRRLTTYRLLEMAGKCKRVKIEMVEKGIPLGLLVYTMQQCTVAGESGFVLDWETNACTDRIRFDKAHLVFLASSISDFELEPGVDAFLCFPCLQESVCLVQTKSEMLGL